MKHLLQSLVLMFVAVLPMSAQTQSYTQIADGVYTDVRGRLFICSGAASVEGINSAAANIYSFALTPPAADANSFTGQDVVLHVPSSATADYLVAPNWNFYSNMLGDAVEPLQVVLEFDEIVIETGDDYAFHLDVLPHNASIRWVQWTSTNRAVAIADDGFLEAKSVGECDIIANCLGKQAVCHIVVTPLRAHIALDEHEMRLAANQQAVITPTITPEPTALAATSSNTDVATVSVNDGTVLVQGVSKGTATITIGTADGTPYTDAIEVTVYNVVGDITGDGDVTPSDITMLIDCLLASEPDAAVMALADVNGDGSVSPADIAILIEYLIGSIDLNPELTAKPVITTDKGENAITVTAVGDGDVVLYVDGVAVDNPYVAVRGQEAYAITAYATAQEQDKGMNQSKTKTIKVPALFDPQDATFTVNGVTFTMVAVEGGTFTMGDPSWAGPLHDVTVSSFAIGQTEVTQELWLAVMGSNPSGFSSLYGCEDDLQLPMENVSWFDCQRFLAELNRLTGKQFRLPTEAEWEFAARGGNLSQGSRYAGGAWNSQNSGGRTHPVAQKSPNELGIYDMSGNVIEWCQDWYEDYTTEAQVNPTGPETGTERVARGGSFFFTATYGRVGVRGSDIPKSRIPDMGFRIAL